MSSVNKVILVGRVGQDPEMKHMPNGNAVANITLATSEKWKDKQTGQPQEKTEWHRVKAFGKLAEIIGKYVNKGALLYIEGSLETRKWQDQAGQDRYTTEIKANQMQMLSGQQSGQNQEPQQAQPQYQKAPQPQQASGQFYQQPPGGGGGNADFITDEVPF